MNEIKREVFRRTFNHEDVWNHLLHLFGDNYHIEHHLVPNVPQYKLWRVHYLYRALGFAPIMQYRDKVHGEPKRYCDNGSYKRKGVI